MAFECPQVQQSNGKGIETRVYIAQAEEESMASVASPKFGEEPEDGESLMLRKVLLTPEKVQEEPEQ